MNALRILLLAMVMLAGPAAHAAPPWDELTPVAESEFARAGISPGTFEIAAPASETQAPEPTPAASAAAAARTAPAATPGPGVKTVAGTSKAKPGKAKANEETTSQAVRIAIGLSLLAVLPALLVCLTSFLRIIIVLSMLRHAIGMPETPPNTVLIGLALFLTLFTMSPVLEKVNTQGLQPYLAGNMSTESAYGKVSAPLREFMVRQTREADLALMVELSKAKAPQSMDDISNVQLAPAFMLSELRAAFQIGFVIFLPFLLIDLIVSSVLMALGMMMTPPTSISTPLKILMFILVDGWSLVLKALVGSFH